MSDRQLDKRAVFEAASEQFEKMMNGLPEQRWHAVYEQHYRNGAWFGYQLAQGEEIKENAGKTLQEPTA